MKTILTLLLTALCLHQAQALTHYADSANITVDTRVPTVASPVITQVSGTLNTITMSGPTGSTIRYTLLPTKPVSTSSAIFPHGGTKALGVGNWIIQAAAYLNGVRSDVTTFNFTVHPSPTALKLALKSMRPADGYGVKDRMAYENKPLVIPPNTTQLMSFDVPDFFTKEKGIGAYYGMEVILSDYTGGSGGAPTFELGYSDRQGVAFHAGTNASEFISILPSKVFSRVVIAGKHHVRIKTFGYGASLKVRFHRAAFLQVNNRPVTQLDAYPFWLCVHGKSDHGFSMRPINVSLAYSMTGLPYQGAYNLDWSGGSAGAIIDLSNGRYFQSLSKNIVDKLRVYGIPTNNFNILGHSWGTLVGYEIAKEFGGINRFIALDPAQQALGGYDDGDVDFRTYSNWSVGVKGGGATAAFGSIGKTLKADLSLQVLSDSIHHLGLVDEAKLSGFYHTLPRLWFYHILTNSLDKVETGLGYRTDLRSMVMDRQPARWDTLTNLEDEMDVICNVKTSGTATSPKLEYHTSLLYKNGAGDDKRVRISQWLNGLPRVIEITDP